MGSWTLSLDSPQGAFEQNWCSRTKAARSIAEISSQMQPEAQKVTDITKKRRPTSC